MENQDEYLTALKVPYLIKKVIGGVKLSQTLCFTEGGFNVTMSSRMGAMPYGGRWGEETLVKTGRLLMTHAMELGSLVVRGSMKQEKGTDLVSRELVGGELVMTFGPKKSLKDETKEVSMKMIFKRKPLT